jgi:hypothetical protein
VLAGLHQLSESLWIQTVTRDTRLAACDSDSEPQAGPRAGLRLSMIMTVIMIMIMIGPRPGLGPEPTASANCARVYARVGRAVGPGVTVSVSSHLDLTSSTSLERAPGLAGPGPGVIDENKK